MPAVRVSSQSPWHLVLVVDDSSSMRGSKIRILNQAIVRMIDEMKMISGGMRPYFRITVISFGSYAKVLSEAVSEQDIPIRRVTGMIGSSGGKNAAAGLEAARSVLERNPGASNHFDPFLLFFSDGPPDDVERALREGERIKTLALPSGTVRLITIGLGHADDRFMCQLATQRDGVARYRRLASAQDILEFFPDIGSVALSTNDRPAAGE